MIASRRADELLKESDTEGQRFFKAVLFAILELRRPSRNAGEKVN